MKNKIIAITGGIGSGKSTVCNYFKSLGYTVFSADEVYSKLLSEQDFVREIYSALNIKEKSFVFNRELVSKKVFNNPLALKKLNAVTHPKIMKKMLDLSKTATCKDGVVFNEVPLLFESGYEKLYDKFLVVKRSVNERIDSIIKRDGLTKEQALDRINNQFDYNNLNSSTYTIIENSKSLNDLEYSCKVVLDEIIKK